MGGSLSKEVIVDSLVCRRKTGSQETKQIKQNGRHLHIPNNYQKFTLRLYLSSGKQCQSEKQTVHRQAISVYIHR